MLILKAISLEPVHGYGILLRIEQLSKERLQYNRDHFIRAVRLERKAGSPPNGRE